MRNPVPVPTIGESFRHTINHPLAPVFPLCVICLRDEAVPPSPAVTLVSGTASCQRHIHDAAGIVRYCSEVEDA